MPAVRRVYMFLAGDVGGTKVNLALCEVNGVSVKTHSARRYLSSQFTSLSEVLYRYLDETGAGTQMLDGACFGVPGPVVDGRCVTVNLPWQLDTAEITKDLSRKTQCRNVHLINDLEATAYGTRTLSEGHGLSVLRTSANDLGTRANQALIAPGTGLGEAMMLWNGSEHVISPSEGGHADFGPQDEEQIELLKYLWPRHEHVSWEHVASGPAIYRLYRFLKESGREQEPAELEATLHDPNTDPSPLIAAMAIKNENRICVHAFDLWMFCLGAEAGNLALKSLSLGGIYIGGGIIPNILELFRRPSFFKGLNSKGRMSALIKPMAVYGVIDPLAALYGAAICAKRYSQE